MGKHVNTSVFCQACSNQFVIAKLQSLGTEIACPKCGAIHTVEDDDDRGWGLVKHD